MITQAFVLGAGLGTRLRPLTDELPKPLVPIFGKPLITFAFDHLVALGCRRLTVNTHQLAGEFEKEFPDSTYRARRIEFVHEEQLLGTGGGIANVLDSLGQDPFVVYSGDILTDLDLAALIDAHFRNGNEVTLALRETHFPPSVALRGTSVIDIGSTFGHPGNFDFANVSIWNPDFARRIARAPGSFIPAITSSIPEGAHVGGVVLNDGKWFNVGSPREYLEVHRVIANEQWRPRYLTSDTPWPTLISPEAQVHPSAKISGCTSIAAGAVVHAGAVLTDTILWPHAQIASHAALTNCIVRTRRTVEGTHRDTII